MNHFEDELRKALARREPPDDFTRRVLAQVARDRKPAPVAMWWRMASIAALVIVLFSAAFGYRQLVQHARGEAAKKQLLMALRIAGSELRETQLRVNKVEKQSEEVQQ